MAAFDLPRRLAAEALGTAFLVAAVVGSGIMAETLTRDVALQLLCNTLPTGAVLVVLISILGPISGAHFNPAVSLVFAARGELPRAEAALYIAAQVTGGIAGTMMAHLMFGLPVLELSTKLRTGGGSGSPRRSRRSGSWQPSLRDFAFKSPQSLGWLAFTLRPPTGSPLPPVSPIRR